MSVSVNGIGEVVVTMKAESGVNPGDLVAMKESFLVKKAEKDEEPAGLCVSRNGDIAGVQLRGGMVLPCEDATLTVGYSPLKMAANGSVAKGTSGVSRLVVSVDTTAKTAEILF